MKYIKQSKAAISAAFILSLTVCFGADSVGAYAAPAQSLQQAEPDHSHDKVPGAADIQLGGAISGKKLYLIYTEAGLRSIGTGDYGMDQAYMLAAGSIDLSGGEWLPIGTAGKPFTGYFDGNGCDIKGLTMTDPDASVIGLFGYAENAVIHNVTLKDYHISSAGRNISDKKVNPICAVPVNCDISDTFPEPEGAAPVSPEPLQMATKEIDGSPWYVVENEAQLRSIGTGIYGLDKNYLQGADIDLSSGEWIPIGTTDSPFTGKYDGNGCVITGLTMKDPDAKMIGFFGVGDSATICNVTLKDYDILSAGKNVKGVTRGPILAWGTGTNKTSNNKVYPLGKS